MSLALYCYIATWDRTRKSHTTLFKPRPGSADRADRQTARREFLQDVLPPVVWRRPGHRLERAGLI